MPSLKSIILISRKSSELSEMSRFALTILLAKLIEHGVSIYGFAASLYKFFTKKCLCM